MNSNATLDHISALSKHSIQLTCHLELKIKKSTLSQLWSTLLAKSNSTIFHSILVDSNSTMAFYEHLNAIFGPFLCIKLKNLKMDISRTKLFLKAFKPDHN